jgi:hypothetical protein
MSRFGFLMIVRTPGQPNDKTSSFEFDDLVAEAFEFDTTSVEKRERNIKYRKKSKHRDTFVP